MTVQAGAPGVCEEAGPQAEQPQIPWSPCCIESACTRAVVLGPLLQPFGVSGGNPGGYHHQTEPCGASQLSSTSVGDIVCCHLLLLHNEGQFKNQQNTWWTHVPSPTKCDATPAAVMTVHLRQTMIFDCTQKLISLYATHASWPCLIQALTSLAVLNVGMNHLISLRPLSVSAPKLLSGSLCCYASFACVHSPLPSVSLSLKR